MKSLRRALASLIMLFVLSCIALSVTPPSWETGPDPMVRNSVTSIILVRHHVWLEWAALAMACVLLALAFLSLRIRSLPYRLALWMLPLCLWPISWTTAQLMTLAPWTEYGRVLTAKGEEYRFLDSSFLQGQRMAIARLVERGWLLDRYHVVVEAYGDSPRNYLPIVRPEPVQERYGQLYLSPAGLLIGVRRDNHMYMAYEIQTRQAYASSTTAELSPFLLLTRDSRIHQGDREALLAAGIADEGNHPREAVIRQALAHENAQVRELAEDLLGNLK